MSDNWKQARDQEPMKKALTVDDVLITASGAHALVSAHLAASNRLDVLMRRQMDDLHIRMAFLAVLPSGYPSEVADQVQFVGGYRVAIIWAIRALLSWEQEDAAWHYMPHVPPDMKTERITGNYADCLRRLFTQKISDHEGYSYSPRYLGSAAALQFARTCIPGM